MLYDILLLLFFFNSYNNGKWDIRTLKIFVRRTIKCQLKYMAFATLFYSNIVQMGLFISL